VFVDLAADGASFLFFGSEILPWDGWAQAGLAQAGLEQLKQRSNSLYTQGSEILHGMTGCKQGLSGALDLSSLSSLSSIARMLNFAQVVLA
jgi:hypothetical protein